MPTGADIRSLASGYSCETDTLDEQAWNRKVQEFADGNIYQTWAYANVVGGARNISRLVLKKDSEIVAMAQARVKRLPFLRLGIAYVQWGPLWCPVATQARTENFRQAVRALRNEFICRRGLALRLFPIVFEDTRFAFNEILAEEGFSSIGEESRGRTILMDLSPALTDIRDGMQSHWKRELKVAEKQKLELVEGCGEDLFGEFIGMYKEMVARKKFVEPNDIHQFQQIQRQLPDFLKMRILLCKSNGQLCAGAIYSRIGTTAIYLFGATSNIGMKSRGSYFLQWKVLDALKLQGAAVYNLNGINPEKNPGTYKFKSDMAGQYGTDVRYLGRFDVHPGNFSRAAVRFADGLRTTRRRVQERIVAHSAPTKHAGRRVENPEVPVAAADEAQVTPASQA